MLQTNTGTATSAGAGADVGTGHAEKTSEASTPEQVEHLQHSQFELEDAVTISSKATFRLCLHALAVASAYFATNIHLVGSNILSHSIGAILGGADKAAWMGLILTFYPVVLGPPVCRATDFWGRKWMMVAALALGAIGSIIVARADTIGQAIAGQAIAGVAGINQALPQAVTSEVLPRRFRPYAQVLINIPGGVAAAVGTYLTGVMTRGSPEGFRNYFYLVMALYAFSASIIVSTYQPPTRELQCLALREKLYRLDLPGCLLLAVGLLGVSLALCWSSNPYSWKNAHVLAPLIIGLCSMVILTLYAVFYRKDGIFHHGLFKRRNFWVSELCFLGEGVAFIAANMYLGQQLELMYGASSWEVALVFGVAWWTWAASAPLCGWFIVKTQRAKVVIVIALASFTLYFALMAATNLSTRANIWGYNVFLGLGQGGGILALVTVAQLSVSPELIAPATGLIVATRTFGACMGITIFSAILNSAVSSKLVPSVSRAAEAAGLPASSLEQFISALNGNHPDALASVPGVTDQVIQAATTASRKVYNLGFRNGYAAAAAFTTFAMFAALGLKDIKHEYSAAIDAPLKPELSKLGIKTAEEEA